MTTEDIHSILEHLENDQIKNFIIEQSMDFSVCLEAISYLSDNSDQSLSDGCELDPLIEEMYDIVINQVSARLGSSDVYTRGYLLRRMFKFVERNSEHAFDACGRRNPFRTRQTQPAPTATVGPRRGQTAPLPGKRVWRWPEVEAPPGRDSAYKGDHIFERQRSALKLYGYTVGTNGWSTRTRQEFLSDFMELELPSRVQDEYDGEYGAPMTAKRLKKVVDVIAANCRNFRRNNERRYSAAISDYEEDLKYLKEKYYNGSDMKFYPWPTTRPS